MEAGDKRWLLKNPVSFGSNYFSNDSTEQLINLFRRVCRITIKKLGVIRYTINFTHRGIRITIVHPGVNLFLSDYGVYREEFYRSVSTPFRDAGLYISSSTRRCNSSLNKLIISTPTNLLSRRAFIYSTSRNYTMRGIPIKPSLFQIVIAFKRALEAMNLKIAEEKAQYEKDRLYIFDNVESEEHTRVFREEGVSSFSPLFDELLPNGELPPEIAEAQEITS